MIFANFRDLFCKYTNNKINAELIKISNVPVNLQLFIVFDKE